MKFENKQYDEERALYGIRDSLVSNCVFDGEADGESLILRLVECAGDIRRTEKLPGSQFEQLPGTEIVLVGQFLHDGFGEDAVTGRELDLCCTWQ